MVCNGTYTCGKCHKWINEMSEINELQAQINLAVQKERERCALIVEQYSLPTIQTPSMWLIDKAAIIHRIRADDN